MAHNNTFWNQLLLRSDSIGDINSQAPDASEQLLAQLATIGEQFDRVFDPADQFEEYVAVAFCQAIQRALQPKRPAAAGKISVAAAGTGGKQTAAPTPKKSRAKKTDAKSSANALPAATAKPPQRRRKKSLTTKNHLQVVFLLSGCRRLSELPTPAEREIKIHRRVQPRLQTHHGHAAQRRARARRQRGGRQCGAGVRKPTNPSSLCCPRGADQMPHESDES